MKWNVNLDTDCKTLGNLVVNYKYPNLDNCTAYRAVCGAEPPGNVMAVGMASGGFVGRSAIRGPLSKSLR